MVRGRIVLFVCLLERLNRTLYSFCLIRDFILTELSCDNALHDSSSIQFQLFYYDFNMYFSSLSFSIANVPVVLFAGSSIIALDHLDLLGLEITRQWN